MLETIDHVLLSRLQFAFTVSFHIIFPAFTIGLASWLAFLEGLHLKTGNPVYKHLYQFWVKIFAVAFGMGVVSGLVMSFEFGTNWSGFSDKIGNVLAPLIGFEVLTAFFLEASFLGIMLFGWNRVSPKMHYFSTCMVAFGTLLSAFWILSANSFMHTPQGYVIGADNVLLPESWLAILFNPSFPHRFFHMVAAAFLTTSFVICGTGAYYLLKARHVELAKPMFQKALIIIIVLTPIQLFLGDSQGRNTLQYQPEKIAAIEGLWETTRGADMVLFAIPDQAQQKNLYEIKIPHLASLILTHTYDGKVVGLKNWAQADQPPVFPVFFAFRAMVGIGVLMLFTAIGGLVLMLRKHVFGAHWFHRWCVLMAPSGFLAVLAGWFVTEIGRQPYVVYGVLKTKDMVSPITTMEVGWSLLFFVLIYSFVFACGITYIIRLIVNGPDEKQPLYGEHPNLFKGEDHA